MNIDDINYKDIVVAIPENAVKMTINVSFYENDEIHKAVGEYNMSDIKECEDILEQYINGDLPKYTLTEEYWNKICNN